MSQLSENSLKILQRRYLRRDAEGRVTETPEQMFRRVAKAVAAAEDCWPGAADTAYWEEKFFTVMQDLLFLPNSPTLMNAGTGAQQLSACFVLPVEDNLNSIFTTLKHAALIQQSGGGTGFNFSRLRPRNDLVNSSGGTASGPVSFMKIFDSATEHIKQGGKRRGANMGILDINHPDIEEFIFSKRERGELTNFNISAGITDAFMEAVTKNEDWSLIHPNSKKTVKKLRARTLWEEIVESAWLTGDPGLVFLDTINRANPTPALGRIGSTNPCGEVPLLPYESCNLGSVNLSRFIRNGNKGRELDWEKLEEVVGIAVRFLDNIIEINHYIMPEIKTMARGNRKIGLGVMGWAELLVLLGIPYESEEALGLASRLMRFIRDKSLAVSQALGEARGVFPNWQQSIYYPDQPLRNATRTSIAPTGTISIIAGTSSSIEPLFALAFRRQHVLNEEILFSINPLFVQYLREHQLYSESIAEQAFREGHAGGIEELPSAVKDIFKTALEIDPAWHLRHQLVFQEFTDNAVSKTINLPESATRKEVEEIYRQAWLQKAKGITIFRNNSRGMQVIQQGIPFKTEGCKVCRG